MYFPVLSTFYQMAFLHRTLYLVVDIVSNTEPTHVSRKHLPWRQGSA